MKLNLPLVPLLGFFVVLLVRKAGLKAGHAVITTLFGFYLAQTFLRGQVGRFDTALAHLVGAALR